MTDTVTHTDKKENRWNGIVTKRKERYVKRNKTEHVFLVHCSRKFQKKVLTLVCDVCSSQVLAVLRYCRYQLIKLWSYEWTINISLVRKIDKIADFKKSFLAIYGVCIHYVWYDKTCKRYVYFTHLFYVKINIMYIFT